MQLDLDKSFRGPVLSEAIRKYVKEYILEHRLGPGDSLPPETRLAAELGVGRSSVREAVKALQALGIVEVRHGDGLYVREYNFDPILETISYGSHFDASTLAELAQIRDWLELETIVEAITRARPEHIGGMEAAIAAWRATDRPAGDASERERDFQRALYAPLDNESLLKLLEVFWAVLRDPLVGYDTYAESLAHCEAILRAAKASDPSAAVRAALARRQTAPAAAHSPQPAPFDHAAQVGEPSFRRPALNAAVRGYIKQYILDRGLKPGDALSTEGELANDLGIGRTSVREAVKSLQSLGIVEVRHGGGLYVREYNFDPVLEVLGYGVRFDSRTLAELLEIRMWLESAVIADAIRSMTPADIAHLQAIIAPWEARVEAGAAGTDAIKEWDQAFHRALYTPLGNETLVKLIDVFWMAFGEFVGEYRNEPEPDLQEHVRILRAVAGREIEAARRAVRENIARNQERFRLIRSGEPR